MNYFHQLNGFWRWNEMNGLNHKAIVLYLVILDIANSMLWKRSFSIPNTTLMSKSKLCKSELHKQRLMLIQSGLIAYEKGKKGTAGTYMIGLLFETNPETNIETNPETNIETNPEDIPKRKQKQKQKGDIPLTPQGGTSDRSLVEKTNLAEPERQSLTEWFSYKKGKYKLESKHKLIAIFERKIAEYGAEAVINLVDECIANGYQGLTWDKLERQPPKGGDTPYRHQENGDVEGWSL